MIKYLRHTEIDKQRWDDCISNAENGLIYALSWYLDIVSPNWDGLIKDDYEAVMPLTWKKKFGIYYLVQPVFCQQLGVFGDQNDSRMVDDFINQIPKKFLSIRVHLNEKNKLFSKGVTIFNRLNYKLDLKPSYPGLFKSFSGSHQKNIKTGRNKDIRIETSTDVSKLYSFFIENHHHKFTLDYSAYDILKRILSAFKRHEDYSVYFAYTKDAEIVAAIFLIKSFNRWILLLAPSNNSGQKKRAVYLLIDKFIQEHSECDEILDFEGSTIRGIAEFYNGFGAEAVTYPYIKYRRIPFIP
jgi:hypothetical protein